MSGSPDAPTATAEDGIATTAVAADLETFLLDEGLLDAAVLERARRIAAKLERPKRTVDVLIELGQLSKADYERINRLHRSRLPLVGILREDGAIGEAGLEAFEAARRADPKASERDLLLRNRIVTEERFLRALATKHDLAFVEPQVSLVDPKVLEKTSIPWLLRKRALPLRIVDGTLSVVLSDPLDTVLLDELKAIYAVPVKPSCGPSRLIEKALLTLERVNHRSGAPPGNPAVQYREIVDDAGRPETGDGAVALVDYLLLRAAELGASDLHIEPMRNKLRVRARVDGVLRDVTDLPADFIPQIVSRVKILAGADIAERRLHQDGRIFVKIGEREYDIRVSTYTSVFGENLVLRLLGRSGGLPSLEDLNFEPRVLAALRMVALRSASGIVLVTGPTGSGKTTTLYSFVDFVNQPGVKIITAEDPVEYVIEGIVQCSVNDKTGPTFSDSLRAIVRQDPDVIVVGEIRDGVTASLAVTAALTGHKVFATLHTEDSVSSVLRLLDMGIEPFVLASTLSAVVAQRLVRRVCRNCAAPADPPREDMRFLGLDRGDLAGGEIVAGPGCDHCGGNGFRGRVGIHEVFLPSDDFRDAIMRRAATREMRELARQGPAFLSLQEDGVLKAMAGLTTLAEVVENAPRDEHMRKPAILHGIARSGSLL